MADLTRYLLRTLCVLVATGRRAFVYERLLDGLAHL